MNPDPDMERVKLELGNRCDGPGSYAHEHDFCGHAALSRIEDRLASADALRAEDYPAQVSDLTEMLRDAETELARLRRAEEATDKKMSLSPRELEILELVAQGYTSAITAAKLGVTPHTVKTHRQRILSKLGAHTIAQAISIAHQRGILREEAHDDAHASSGDAEGDAVRVPKTPGASSRVVVRDDERGSLETPYWCRVGAGYAIHWADHVWEGRVLTACGYDAGPPVSGWEEKYVAVCYWCKRRMQGEG